VNTSSFKDLAITPIFPDFFENIPDFSSILSELDNMTLSNHNFHMTYIHPFASNRTFFHNFRKAFHYNLFCKQLKC